MDDLWKFERWFDKIPGQGRFTRQQCKDIAGAAWIQSIATLIAERDALQAATRKVVEALLNYRMQHDAIRDEEKEEDPECQCVDCDSGRAALADPVIVALRRE